MLKHASLLATLIFLIGATATQPSTQPADSSNDSASSTETIVIFRHGEKAADGSGQLSPRGFNRAIALSNVLPAKYGRPAALFAPDPYEKTVEATGLENYVRPLATIEPTAIKLGMPVKTPCGYRDDAALTDEVIQPVYANATVFVAWEHGYAKIIASDLVKKYGGDAKAVPTWTGDDYDSIYVVKIIRLPGAAPAVSFQHDQENLDNQSEEMPETAPAK